MGNLENAIAQCKGVEAQGWDGKTSDLGKENARLLAEFNSAVSAKDGGDGLMGFLNKQMGKIDGGSMKNALASSTDSASIQVMKARKQLADDISSRMRNEQQEALFTACSDIGNKIRIGASATRNSSAAKEFIASVARNNPTEITGTKRVSESAVAQADNYQDGINALKKGARAAAISKALGE